MHQANTKHKWKKMQEQIEQLARMVQHYAQVSLLHEDDLKTFRDMKNQLIEKGLLEAEEAKTEDYFPPKSEEDKEEKIDGE